MLPRLDLNDWAPAILLPQPQQVAGSKGTYYHAQPTKYVLTTSFGPGLSLQVVTDILSSGVVKITPIDKEMDISC
jgi:hypothetical protein